jgi:hypothetical protein
MRPRLDVRERGAIEYTVGLLSRSKDVAISNPIDAVKGTGSEGVTVGIGRPSCSPRAQGLRALSFHRVVKRHWFFDPLANTGLAPAKTDDFARETHTTRRGK